MIVRLKFVQLGKGLIFTSRPVLHVFLGKKWLLWMSHDQSRSWKGAGCMWTPGNLTSVGPSVITIYLVIKVQGMGWPPELPHERDGPVHDLSWFCLRWFPQVFTWYWHMVADWEGATFWWYHILSSNKCVSLGPNPTFQHWCGYNAAPW